MTAPKRAHEEDDDKTVHKREDKVPKVSQSGKMVTIKIKTVQEFRVHAHLLVQYSDYFLKALNSGLAESSSLEFELEEHANEKTMGFLVNWVYEKPYNTTPQSLQNIVDRGDKENKWENTAFACIRS
ncbi:uncharacterized protein B0I36DRAFT_382444 [Microdochium trichocladiopsis]|uniref:BTB domain-containing protein n=1 Tax=Microdochium trichocladiopsis TaxID=1682393 RepID=A0A9P8YCF0_9PEZI|nr:uncharacterized protein B0I36DRAFT_382444 [Microdochium trichocladiopsis]KAH7035811.1 hypothetical protein B0I36DRAFT_382444 [Microdochium trichocladiopsis]